MNSKDVDNMQETSRKIIQEIFSKQRQFFHSQATKPIAYRKEMLRKLQSAIHQHENEIAEALHQDLNKSFEEAYLTEIGIVYSELKLHIKKIRNWSKAQHVATPLVLFPSKSTLLHEPLGNALIISPWNYPFQLIMNPLIGAISAGNCAIIKPSPDAPSVAKVIEKIISSTFDKEYIACIQGGKETNENLFHFPFDVVFFTGSSHVGSIVMQAFAKHLSKVILELGGKSPCIVDADANVKIAAKRIAWGKTINAGQTCIAPDYIFLHESIKSNFIEKFVDALQDMHGTDIKQSKYYGRIVHLQAFDRLTEYLNDGEIVIGGNTDKSQKFLEPTVLEKVELESSVMQEEIFGPILPIITFDNRQEIYTYLKRQPQPLALYYFGKSEKEVLQNTTSGGACINDTLVHIVNHKLPFGGVGNSGLGQYHGKYSFDSFSHLRAVVSTPTWIDIPLKYAPYKFFDWIKHLF